MSQGKYTIKDLYQGSTSSLSPNYGDHFSGYRTPAGSLGSAQLPTTANQLNELDKNLKQGMKVSEVGAIKPDDFETIPKHHFAEMRRTAKLAGANPTMHAPVQGMEPSGVDPQQGGWSEAQRKMIEYKLNDVADKAHEMDTRGNIPITIHAANIPGTEKEKIVDENGNEKVVEGQAAAIDQKTGQITKLQRDFKYTPGEMKDKQGTPEGQTWTVDAKIKNQNRTSWSDSVDEILFNKDRADEILSKNGKAIKDTLDYLHSKDLNDEQVNQVLEQKPELQTVLNKFETAKAYLEDTEKKVQNLFDEAYRYRENDPEEAKKKREILNKKNKEFSEKLEKVKGDPNQRSQVLQKFMSDLKSPEIAPQRYQRMEDFAKKESAKTFGNVALENYKKFGEKAPVVSIENIDQDRFAFANGKDMNQLIEESKNHFKEEAKKKLNLSENEAKKKADKLIGLTFDVGHLNISKNKGLNDEDLKKEFQQMSKHLKHIHLTDNFGHHDSHLAPGMGNVPFKQYYEEMKKKGFNPDEIDQIVESGGIINHFNMSPHPYSVQGMGSPMYSEDNGPYWNQSPGLEQGYSAGYGEFLPQGHFSQWGGGFSQLPSELGGSLGGGGGSRVSGNPME